MTSSGTTSPKMGETWEGWRLQTRSTCSHREQLTCLLTLFTNQLTALSPKLHGVHFHHPESTAFHAGFVAWKQSVRLTSSPVQNPVYHVALEGIIRLTSSSAAESIFPPWTRHAQINLKLSETFVSISMVTNTQADEWLTSVGPLLSK